MGTMPRNTIPESFAEENRFAQPKKRSFIEYLNTQRVEPRFSTAGQVWQSLPPIRVDYHKTPSAGDFYDYYLGNPKQQTKPEGISAPVVEPEQPIAVPEGNLWSITGGQRYPVTQEYMNYNPSMYSSGYHSGIDIGTPMGTKLYAPLSGVVVQAGWYGNYGNAVVIQRDDGAVLILGHLSAVSVAPGQRVNAGDMVGLSGNSGYSTGPHLHVEMRDANGNIVDPRRYLTE